MGKAFDFAAEEIERQSDLATLEARGTLRLALKEAGFDPNRIGARDLAAVVEKALPRELAVRGVPDGEDVCRRIAASLAGLDEPEDGCDDASPESVFARLAGH
jgi:hypothetical protein